MKEDEDAGLNESIFDIDAMDESENGAFALFYK